MTIKEDPWTKLISHNQHKLLFGNAHITVDDGVFTPDPKLTYSSSLIIDNLPTVLGKRIADIGTGSGVIAVIAALQGATEVIATDISDRALQNALFNAKANQVSEKIKIVRSNLLEEVDGPFDLICANLPILDEVWMDMVLEINCLSTIEVLLSQAKSKLNAKGEIYLSWASFAEVAPLEKLLKKAGYNYRLIEVRKLDYSWYLYILSAPVD